MKNAIMMEHGETTCASEPGKFCLFLGAKCFGTKPVCMLFDDTPLREDFVGGWVKRCDQCMSIFTGDRIVTKEDFK